MEDHDMNIVSGLKDPWKFLFVDMDIAMVSACVGFLALTAGAPTPAVVAIGAGVGYGMHASRKGRPKGFARHLAYWYLPRAVTQLRAVPPMWSLRTVG